MSGAVRVADVPGDKTFERYCTFSRGRERGFAVRGHHAEVMRALLDRWRCEPVGAMGRGQLFTFPVLPGKGVLREYRRGGFMQRLLREGSLTNRPLREWEVLNYLYRRDFPVPGPLGVLWRRRNLLVTGAIATQFIDAVNLADFLCTTTGPPEHVLEEVGRLIRRLHDLHVYHADLHVGNILVAAKPFPLGSVYFVDFDNARVTAVTALLRAQNLLRLRRSFAKHRLRMADFERIRAGYGPVVIPGWLESAYEIRSAASDWLNRRTGSNGG